MYFPCYRMYLLSVTRFLFFQRGLNLDPYSSVVFRTNRNYMGSLNKHVCLSQNVWSYVQSSPGLHCFSLHVIYRIVLSHVILKKRVVYPGIRLSITKYLAIRLFTCQVGKTFSSLYYYVITVEIFITFSESWQHCYQNLTFFIYCLMSISGLYTVCRCVLS